MQVYNAKIYKANAFTTGVLSTTWVLVDMPGVYLCLSGHSAVGL